MIECMPIESVDETFLAELWNAYAEATNEHLHKNPPNVGGLRAMLDAGYLDVRSDGGNLIVKRVLNAEPYQITAVCTRHEQKGKEARTIVATFNKLADQVAHRAVARMYPNATAAAIAAA